MILKMGLGDPMMSLGEIFNIGSLFPILSKKVSKGIPITMGYRFPGMTSQILTLVPHQSMHLILHMSLNVNLLLFAPFYE